MLRQEFTYVKQVGMCFTVTKDWNVLPIVIKVSVRVVGLLLVLFSFWKIFSFLLPLRRRVSPRLRSNQEKLMLAAHMQSARTMIVFVLVYLVLVVPKFVVCILTNRRAQPVTRAIENDDLFCAFQWLYWLQCACKPIIYFLRSRRCISCLRKYCGPDMINENMTSCFSTSRSPLYEGNGNNLVNTSSSVPSHQEREFLNLCRTSIELVPITNTARSVPEQGRTAEESTPQSIEVIPVSTENVVQYSDVFFEDLESNTDEGKGQTTPS